MVTTKERYGKLGVLDRVRRLVEEEPHNFTASGTKSAFGVSMAMVTTELRFKDKPSLELKVSVSNSNEKDNPRVEEQINLSRTASGSCFYCLRVTSGAEVQRDYDELLRIREEHAKKGSPPQLVQRIEDGILADFSPNIGVGPLSHISDADISTSITAKEASALIDRSTERRLPASNGVTLADINRRRAKQESRPQIKPYLSS